MKNDPVSLQVDIYSLPIGKHPYKRTSRLTTLNATYILLGQRINFESDWKVISLFVGGNDICDHCHNSVSTNVEL